MIAEDGCECSSGSLRRNTWRNKSMRGKVFAIIGAAVAAMVACSGDEGRLITGSVARAPSGVAARNTNTISHIADPSMATEIWALPLRGASFDHHSLQSKEVLPLAEDGSFVYTTHKGDDAVVLVLVNAPACEELEDRASWDEALLDTRLDCVVGYVGLPDATEGGAMIAIPTGELEQDLELGEVSMAEGDEAHAEEDLEDAAQSFAIDIDSLRALAQVDDLLFAIRYAFANHDESGRGVHQMIDYKWQGALSGAIEEFSDPATHTFYGYQYYFTSNIDAQAWLAGAGQSAGYLQLYPPGDVITPWGDTYGPTTPMITDPATGGGEGGGSGAGYRDELYQLRMDGDGDGPLLFGSVGPAFDGMAPAGEWKMSAGGDGAAITSKYDLSLVAPFEVNAAGEANTAAPIVFVPRVRVRINGDTVESIDLAWSIFDGSTMIPVDDAIAYGTVAAPYITLSGSSCSDSSGNSGEELSADNASFSPQQQSWTLGGSACVLERLYVGYEISGLRFSVEWM